MHEIKVKCPAKINLTLEILNKREDGFHNIQSVMQTIDLFDILTIKIEENNKFEIKLSGTSDEIPYDERNLVHKAILLFVENTNLSPHKIDVFIEKNIPIAAGLAGGSTDAAGTLWGLNKLFGEIAQRCPDSQTRGFNPLPLAQTKGLDPLPNDNFGYFSKEELHELCAQLGSDLNFCLEGGCQLATSRGEILKKLPFQEFSLSLIKPKNLGISAKEAYTKFSELENKPNLNMTEKLVNALKSTGGGAHGAPYSLNLQEFLHNDLEIALIEDYQELKQIKTTYPNSLMSGSGSTFFILQNEINNLCNDFWLKTDLKSIPYGVSEL